MAAAAFRAAADIALAAKLPACTMPLPALAVALWIRLAASMVIGANVIGDRSDFLRTASTLVQGGCCDAANCFRMWLLPASRRLSCLEHTQERTKIKVCNRLLSLQQLKFVQPFAVHLGDAPGLAALSPPVSQHVVLSRALEHNKRMHKTVASEALGAGSGMSSTFMVQTKLRNNNHEFMDV